MAGMATAPQMAPYMQATNGGVGGSGMGTAPPMAGMATTPQMPPPTNGGIGVEPGMSDRVGNPATPMMKAEFVYSDGALADVKLSGSWNDWVPVQMHYEADGLWSVLTPVPVGKHEYRFIVDGEWKVSSRHPTVGSEEDDTLNNFREILPYTPKKKNQTDAAAAAGGALPQETSPAAGAKKKRCTVQ